MSVRAKHDRMLFDNAAMRLICAVSYCRESDCRSRIIAIRAHMLIRNRDNPGSGLFCWGMTFLLNETFHASCTNRKIEISAFSQIGKPPCAHGAQAGRSKYQRFRRPASRRVHLARESEGQNLCVFTGASDAVVPDAKRERA